MNTCVHFVSGGSSEVCRTLGVNNDVITGAEVVSDVPHMRPQELPTPCPAIAPAPMASRQPALIDEDGPEDQGLPPARPHITCSDYDPPIVRFLNGPDSLMRTTWLRARVAELADGCHHELLMHRGQNELDIQLHRAAAKITALFAQFPERRVFVGINGIDQRLTSPSAVALGVEMLVNIGATVICTVDRRYMDAYLLTCHLRMFGIKVVHERLLSSQRSGRSVSLRIFPVVHTPALTAYVSQKHHEQFAKNDVTVRDFRDREPERREICKKNAVRSVIEKFTRAENARAYRNEFAVNQLLREWKNC